MAYAVPLRTPLNFSSVDGGCAHFPRSIHSLGCRRGRPECQTPSDIPHVGFFLLKKEWLTQEQRLQLECVPRKEARCYWCRTDFLIVWEKYHRLFEWDKIVKGRYRESLFISRESYLREEFETQDAAYSVWLQDIAKLEAEDPARLAANKARAVEEFKAREDRLAAEAAEEAAMKDAEAAVDALFVPHVCASDEEYMEVDYELAMCSSPESVGDNF